MKRTAWRAAMFLVSVSVGTLAVTARLAPAWADDDPVLHTHYDGVSNDLLTAGLGKSGLGSAVPPGFVDPLHPTAEELRRL
ncbi:MAG: 3-hydroxybutyrate oligomer hydrolase family protein, partial [Xanthobacteraceae bacterium]